MSETTKIEWCDSTFNPWIGCTKISPGCDHCYAERQMDQRLGRVRWGAGQPRQRTSAAYWRQPERWSAEADRFRECGACGWRGQIEISASPVPFACPVCDAVDWRAARRRVFCASLADVFDKDVEPAWRRDLFDLISRCRNLDFLILTKRIGNALDMIDTAWLFGTVSRGPWPTENVWLGATVVNQAEADRDIPKLLATPAAVRFVSVEPMLGHVDISRWMPHRVLRTTHDRGCARTTLDWVIVGGESGPGARPMHPDWVRSLRDQCQAAGVPFMLKQWGEWAPASEVGGGEIRHAICKHSSGRQIDGREWLDLPA